MLLIGGGTTSGSRTSIFAGATNSRSIFGAEIAGSASGTIGAAGEIGAMAGGNVGGNTGVKIGGTYGANSRLTLGFAFSSIGFGTVSGCARGRGGNELTGGTISTFGAESTTGLAVTSAGASTNSETGFMTDLDIVGNASGTLTLSGMGTVGDVTAAGSAVALMGKGVDSNVDSAGAAEGFSGSIFKGMAVPGFAFAPLAVVLFVADDAGALLVTRACNDALKPPSICDARLGPPPVASPNKTTSSTCNNIDKITNLPTST